MKLYFLFLLTFTYSKKLLNHFFKIYEITTFNEHLLQKDNIYYYSYNLKDYLLNIQCKDKTTIYYYDNLSKIK